MCQKPYQLVKNAFTDEANSFEVPPHAKIFACRSHLIELFPFLWKFCSGSKRLVALNNVDDIIFHI
jgi:hypothetical protein